MGCLFLGFIVLERFLRAKPGLFSGILFLAMVIAMVYEGPRERPAESSSNRINRIVRANPWIKVWLGVCALCATALAVVAIHYDVDVEKRMGFGGLLGAILLIGAPILVMGERERYLSLGASS